jgi:hypothetical protein
MLSYSLSLSLSHLPVLAKSLGITHTPASLFLSLREGQVLFTDGARRASGEKSVRAGPAGTMATIRGLISIIWALIYGASLIS